MTHPTSSQSLHWRLDPGVPLAHLQYTNRKLVNGFELNFHFVELGGDAGLLPHFLFLCCDKLHFDHVFCLF